MDKNYGYKHTKGFIVILVILILGMISVAYGQVVSGSVNTPSGYSIDSITGNLIPYDSSLKTSNGWTSSLGSAQGSFDPTDGYTFSFPLESLGVAGLNLGGFPHGYQNTNAVFVTGFSYGLKYRFPCANSIGGYCEDNNGIQDTLRVDVGYYPASGSPTFYIHQLGLKNINDGNSPYNPTWQQLSETVTFAGAKTLSQAGSVNFEIVGQDAGGWACIMPNCYGPQVKDAYLRANYSVDPCILNPAFNPSCPGFQNVLQGAKSPTFYYSYNIAQSLPHIGGGVILHGYDYGFNWYNYGACYNTFMFWCTDWRTDGGGNINFRISDKNNTTMLQQQWYVAGNNSGGGYSNRYLFTESRNSLDMGSVQWWASDVWNHFGWSGWTRPIWTPDPCFDQPLYSPNCSNFDAEIKRLAAEQKATQEASLANTVATVSSTTSTPTSSITTTVNDATTTSPTVTVTTVENQPTVIATPQTTAATISDSTTRNTTRPNINISDNTSMALNLISRNQEKESNIALQASRTAIETANNASISSIKQAETIALTNAEKSNTVNSIENQTTNTTSNRDQESLILPTNNVNTTSVVTMAIQQRNVVSTTQVDVAPTNTITQTSAVIQFNAMTVTNPDQAQSFNIIQPPNQVQQTQQNQITMYQSPNPQQITDFKPIESTQQNQTQTNNIQVGLIQPIVTQNIEQTVQPTQIVSINPVTSVDLPMTVGNFLTDRTNPINDIIENKQVQQQNTTQQTRTDTVNKNAQDNDAAVGVSINQIAITPVGFNAYNIALKDVAFYAPKEIYRNQKTIDNARALRQLASDKLHQEMVDMQYRR